MWSLVNDVFAASLYIDTGSAVLTCQNAEHIQLVRLLVSARAYQPANSVFLSQQISTSRAYQPRNQPANRLIVFSNVPGKPGQYVKLHPTIASDRSSDLSNWWNRGCQNVE